MGIIDKLTIILWNNFFINKHNIVKVVQEKANQMHHQIKDFRKMFQEIFDEVLPPFWDNDGSLFSQEQYHNFVVHSRMGHSKFEYLTKGMTGKVIIEKLTDDFEIFGRFLITHSSLPPISYTSYVELKVSIKDMMDYDILNQEKWKFVEKFRNTEYRLHQIWIGVVVLRTSSSTSFGMPYGFLKLVI